MIVVPASRPEPERLLTPAEVARIFRVDPKTVTRWDKAGKLHAVRTLGGHRRFRSSEVQALLERTVVVSPLDTTLADSES